jgi:hypothetical protein
MLAKLEENRSEIGISMFCPWYHLLEYDRIMKAEAVDCENALFKKSSTMILQA